MKCAGCGFDNPQANKFCGGCGDSLGSACQKCGFENPQGFSFCGQCGQDLSSSAAAAPASQPRPSTTSLQTAERRHLTILFCDLVDSTPLAEKLDPEDLRSLVLQYQAAAGRAIERYEGHVAQYLGDGLLVYFGYPLAHEHDAQRALYSGLEIIEAIKALNVSILQRWGLELEVRIGIHSGSVVTGDVGTGQRSERLAVGQAPNIAARLQGIAGLNEVLLSDSTAKIVQGVFKLQDLGAQTLKGISEPLTVYKLQGETDLRTRFQAGSPQGMSPFVGRERELVAIHQAVDLAANGQGQVLVISGDPGIGKSRLIEQARNQLGDRVRWTALACSPYHANSAMYPISVYLHRLINIQAGDDAATTLTKLETYIDELSVAPDFAVPVLASIMSLDIGDTYPRLPASPKLAKDQTIEVLDRLLVSMHDVSPVVFLVEDLQWVDPSTREYLDHLVLIAQMRPVLVLASCRPEFQDWGTTSHIEKFVLQPLARTDVQVLLEALLKDARVPDWVRQEIQVRTDGVPIFIEELTKMMISNSADNRQWEQPDNLGQLIPTTLQDSLIARLDGLGEARDTLQRASVLGREFSYDLLRLLSNESEASLARFLHQLLRDQLLVSVEDSQQARFRFRHALLQDAAYASMLRSRRVQLHDEVATVLVDKFPGVVERRPEIVADHLTRAKRIDQALHYWLVAGQSAVKRNTLQEAINLFGRGLALIEQASDSDEVQLIERRMQIGLGSAIANTTNWGNPEACAAFERVDSLCRAIDDEEGQFRNMVSLRMVYTTQGRHQESLQQAKKALSIAQVWDDAHSLAQARAAHVLPSWHVGQYVEAVSHADAGLEALQRLPENRFVLGQRLYFYAYMSQPVWVAGQPDRCLEIMRQGKVLVDLLEDPYARSFFLVYGGTALLYLRELDELDAFLTEACAIGEEHGFGSILDWAGIQQGWLLAQRGEPQLGVEKVQSSLASYLRHGAGADIPLCHVLLAETQILAGMWENAIRSLDQAVVKVDRAQEVCHYSEIFRVRGQALGALGLWVEAEEAFQSAIRIAKQQSALGWELRATVALAKLQVDTGDQKSAHDSVVSVLAKFSEGYQTKDLLDAKALVDEIEAAHG